MNQPRTIDSQDLYEDSTFQKYSRIGLRFIARSESLKKRINQEFGRLIVQEAYTMICHDMVREGVEELREYAGLLQDNLREKQIQAYDNGDFERGEQH